jgi:hypothetical protein
MCGTWVYSDVTLSDRKGTSVPIPNMPVLAIDYVCPFTPGAVPKNPCKCAPTQLPSGTGPAMMGVGFDWGWGMGKPEQNPFLQLPQMNSTSSPMPRAYIITTAGVQLGVAQSDIETFQLVPLREGGVPSIDRFWRAGYSVQFFRPLEPAGRTARGDDKIGAAGVDVLTAGSQDCG